jgi:prevent-host-death family protein
MINEVNAVEFRQKLGEMLNVVQYRHDSILIHRDGKPVAALIDVDRFARIRKANETFEEMSGKMAAAYATVPIEEGLAEIDAAIAAARAELRGK